MIGLFKVLVSMTIVWFAAIGLLVFALPGEEGAPKRPQVSYPYEILERDRAHTQMMGTDFHMEMGDDPMWIRTQDPPYLTALEKHIAEVDRMLGKSVQP